MLLFFHLLVTDCSIYISLKLDLTSVIYHLTFSVDQKLNSCLAGHFWLHPSLGGNQMPFGTVVS